MLVKVGNKQQDGIRSVYNEGQHTATEIKVTSGHRNQNIIHVGSNMAARNASAVTTHLVLLYSAIVTRVSGEIECTAAIDVWTSGI